MFFGNAYAAEAGRGQQANWDELAPKTCKAKAEARKNDLESAR
jgi:hypothetical protein